MIERVVGAFLCAVVLAQSAPAQVGHEPERSPYRDLEYSQELTLLSGWMKARHDPAGIAPNGFAMLGARYEWTLTGPLALSADALGGCRPPRGSEHPTPAPRRAPHARRA